MNLAFHRSSNPAWIDACIMVGAGFFIFALLLSAVFDPKIRLLHTLQALIYFAVILLTRRESAWGFGAGAAIAVFWNYLNLFVTTFIAEGIRQLVILVSTGQVERLDLLVAVVAAAGHVLLIVACLAGFLRIRQNKASWGQFFAGGIIAVGYLVAIIFATGPQYIWIIRRVFHV
jgi:hypothetical protein